MATVLTVSHSLKRESICQNVSISLCTHSHIYTVHNTFIHNLCTASLLRLSFLWVYICAGLWCANGRIPFSDVLISDPKQSELTIFQKNKKQKSGLLTPFIPAPAFHWEASLYSINRPLFSPGKPIHVYWRWSNFLWGKKTLQNGSDTRSIHELPSGSPCSV